VGRPSSVQRKPYDVDALTKIAFGLFRKRGYDATSVDQIARAAGITKSSIYHHVDGKEDLLARGVGHALDRLFAVLDEDGATTGPYAERLRFVLHRSVEIELSSLDEVSVLLRLRGNSRTELDALKRRREFDRRVTALVQRAIEHAEIRDDLPPALVTRLLFSMANWLTEWYSPSGSLTVDDITSAITALAFEGLREKRSSRSSRSA
jgi:AcrR family transcriptional regulator